MFRKKRVYIKLSRNKVEITDLETGETISNTAIEDFSTRRNVIGNFNKVDTLIRSTLKELGISAGLFQPRMIALMQQMEDTEEGLGDIEKRALRDLGEQAGAVAVYLLDHSRPLNIDDAKNAMTNDNR